MPLLKFFHVFIVSMPSKDKLKPNHTVIQVAVANHIGTETGSYAEVVRYLITHGKAEITDIKIVSQVNPINF